MVYEFVQYSEEMSEIWDNFLERCKNRHFMFSRLYIAYHRNLFIDYSLMIYDQKRLVALIPAARENDIFHSHPGLSFGGLCYAQGLTMEYILRIVNQLVMFLNRQGFKKLIYKSLPHIYHTLPAEEDRYALFRCGANIFRSDLATVVNLAAPLKYRRGRIEGIRKAKNNRLFVEKSCEYGTFWQLLTNELKKRYDATPTHSLEDIRSLASLFPDNIHLYLCKQNNEILAGVVIFENISVVHVQYMQANEKGRKLGALDLLVILLIKQFAESKTYFSFGISTEKAGTYLNTSLIAFKEGFGGRAVVHDFYELSFGT